MLTRNCTPPMSPPIGTPEPLIWYCHSCSMAYKLSVTRRCLRCTSTQMTNVSYSPAAKRRRRLHNRRLRSIPTAESHDYEFWTARNDWRRFRTFYEANPEAWKRRTMRDLAGALGRERRAKKSKIETWRRFEITKGRLERMLSMTHSCEKDCDYPSQCHSERYEAYMKNPKKVVGPVKPIASPNKNDDGEDEGKPPLCGLLPEFEQEVTDPEEVDDHDEILRAYESQDEWFATSQHPVDDSDNETNEKTDSEETSINSYRGIQYMSGRRRRW
ncbi:hypothetical protein F66182_458 [Fusarium sp. NRRL 66182]|nr:hypothetical protein F66182_458 [Fusarium sp. NRRL 66182]